MIENAWLRAMAGIAVVLSLGTGDNAHPRTAMQGAKHIVNAVDHARLGLQ